MKSNRLPDQDVAKIQEDNKNTMFSFVRYAIDSIDHGTIQPMNQSEKPKNELNNDKMVRMILLDVLRMTNNEISTDEQPLNYIITEFIQIMNQKIM